MCNAGVSASAWRKSSFSEAGNCVEVAHLNGRVLVRDTKLLARSSVLSFSPPKWREFVGRVTSARKIERDGQLPEQSPDSMRQRILIRGISRTVVQSSDRTSQRRPPTSRLSMPYQTAVRTRVHA